MRKCSAKRRPRNVASAAETRRKNAVVEKKTHPLAQSTSGWASHHPRVPSRLNGKRFAAHARGACVTRASHAPRVPCEPELDRAARHRAQRRAQCERTAEKHVADTRSCFRTCDGPINGQYRSIHRNDDGSQCANSGFVTVKKAGKGHYASFAEDDSPFTPTCISIPRAPSCFKCYGLLLRTPHRILKIQTH